MTDPAVEAANRVGKTLPYGFFSKLTSSDLIAAAREALRGWWCWADLRSRRNLPRPIMREARAPRSSGRVSGSLSAATAADTTIIACPVPFRPCAGGHPPPLGGRHRVPGRWSKARIGIAAT